MFNRGLVSINAPDGDVLCGGVLSSGMIVTTHHAIAPALLHSKSLQVEYPYIKDADDQPLVGKAHFIDLGPKAVRRDVAFLWPVEKPPAAVSLPLTIGKTGGRATAYGRIMYDGSWLEIPVKGEIDCPPIKDGNYWFTGTADNALFADKGMSGGAVLREGSEVIVAIVKAVIEGANTGKTHLRHAIVIPASAIKFFLDAALERAFTTFALFDKPVQVEGIPNLQAFTPDFVHAAID